MLGQRDAKAFGVVECPAHEGAVLDTCTVVGEQRQPEVRKLAQRRQRVPGATDRDGPCHGDLGGAARTEGEDFRRHGRGIDGRLRVGHRDDRRVTTQRGRPRPGLDRLGLFPSRLAQVRVEVNEARTDQAPDRVQDARAGGWLNGFVHPDHGAGRHCDVAPGKALGTDHRPAADHQRDVRQLLAPPSRRAARHRAA